MATSSGADRIKHQDHLRKVASGPNFTTLQPFNNSDNSNNNKIDDDDDDDDDDNSYRVGSILKFNCTRQFHYVYA